MRFTRLAPLTVVLAFLGCWSGETLNGDPVGTPGSNQLTAADLALRHSDSAFEAVRALRPNWLRERGRTSLTRTTATQVVIYLDGTRVGGPDYLRQLRASDIDTMHYLNSSDATNRFGTGHVGGAILVTTLRG